MAAVVLGFRVFSQFSGQLRRLAACFAGRRGNPIHVALAKAAAKSEKLAAKVELKAGEHFTRTRKRIRQALIAHGVALEIEALVAQLIGSAPVTIPVNNDDASEDDDAN